jgi:translation initiation factor IF-1
MTKEELLEVEGVVIALLPNLMSRVVLDNGQEILATSSGRLRRNRIRLLVGDRVTVEMSPYDLSKGRVNYRHKDERATAEGARRWILPPSCRRWRTPR